MELGVQIPHTGAQATPELVREWCAVAEAAGFDSLWAYDHLVLARDVRSMYPGRVPAPVAADAMSVQLSPNFEQLTTLAFVAGITDRVKIGTGVTVLALRNAVLNARQLATIDRYSGGRLLCGVGAGWLKEEADAMNMPWNQRGARADEHIELLRSIWTAPGEHIEFHGKFWEIPPMDPEPRPAHPVPILVGGHSEAAIDRAVRLGDGWITANLSLGALSELLVLRDAACKRHDRDPATLPIYCGHGPRRRRSNAAVDDIRRYEELGAHSLHVDIQTLDELKRFADEVLPHL